MTRMGTHEEDLAKRVSALEGKLEQLEFLITNEVEKRLNAHLKRTIGQSDDTESALAELKERVRALERAVGSGEGPRP